MMTVTEITEQTKEEIIERLDEVPVEQVGNVFQSAMEYTDHPDVAVETTDPAWVALHMALGEHGY